MTTQINATAKKEILTLTVKASKKMDGEFIVKNGRKVHCKFYAPMGVRKIEWMINLNGMAFFANSKNEVLDFIKERAEQYLEMMGFLCVVTIKS